jgi:3-phosphoshikimate 1-carboxyvinyltransferase
MSLPQAIEIIPLSSPVNAEITVPGSKSITNRVLVLAGLADGETIISGALWSEDTQVMVECLQELGFMVNVAPDPVEPCNRTITVYGRGGEIPPGGTAAQPLELFVGNAGTAARFLAALVCLGEGCYRLHGVPRMHERPQAALFEGLRQLGYRIEASGEKLPALIYGAGPRPGRSTVSIEESSQFASALLLCADRGKWTILITGENSEESPYVALTQRLSAQFRKSSGRFQVAPDASSASYFWAAGWLSGADIVIRHWTNAAASGQIDARFPGFWPLPPTISRTTDLGDSIMTAIVLAPFARQSIRFTDLGRLRVQECERVVALRTELAKCGAKVIEQGDTLEIHPGTLHGAEIETYNDHRMAMSFSILGLKVPGIKINNPACVKKTFPNFFQKLAAASPHGLGVAFRGVATGETLKADALFAD